MSRERSARSARFQASSRRAIRSRSLRFDHETGQPLRGSDGLCNRCAQGEPGEAIGRINRDGRDLATRFEGYASAADTEKKILRDVFTPGDAYMRSGDLMRLDAQGFYYFVDRVGDTFRWKGENVATTEVAATLSGCPGVSEATVYGVTVPGAEGRAGMALIVADGVLDPRGDRPTSQRPARLRAPDLPAPRPLARGDRDLQA